MSDYSEAGLAAKGAGMDFAGLSGCRRRAAID